MGKRFIIALVLMACGLTGWAQGDISEKLSATTQMFLDDLKSGSKRGDSKGGETTEQKLYASPETIDGRDYISCFLRLKDNTDTKALEKLGVIVQCRFDKGIVTAYVPVDNLLKVADLASVNQVSVASLMTPTTHVARVKTNTDDVLTYFDDARNLGLSKGYDGTGVLLGVIDTGIDFQHIAFKDKNGNSRIVGAYVYNDDYNNGKEFTSSDEIDDLDDITDNNKQDHGTHTSSTAGGSSVIVDGSTVTVTDDHASATYGGMAPGASLYLAGLKSLANTHLANATQKIVEYADAHGMPVVVNNSWGSQDGPHDGTGYMADIYNQYFGDSHPNHIALFASSNDAGFLPDGATGGYHVSGTASFGSPLSTVVRYKGGAINYPSHIADAWTRSTSVSGLAVKIYVLSTSDGSVKKTCDPLNSTGNVSGLGEYCETGGTLKVTFENDNGKKKHAIISSSKLIMKEGYTLAMDIYPATAEDEETIIDVWGGNDCYFTNVPATTDHNWKAGNDDMTASDESTIASVISIGAYVSNRSFKSSDGHNYYYPDYTNGDIAPFSSYATATQSPDGKQYPWITAPGAVLVAGVNHHHTADIGNSYYGSEELIVNNVNYPYGVMQGTSMATPTAAGIVALWLQYAKENNKTLTVSQVKEIMRSTAIHDSYTAGTNASRFGTGKINALGGFISEWPGVYYELSDNGNNTAVISEANNSNEHAYVVLNNRTLYKDGKWNTICLPFGVSDIDQTDNKTFTGTPLEGATVMELDLADSYDHPTGLASDGTLYLNFKTASEIKAGTPYIIKWASDTEHPTILSPVFNGVTIDNSADAIARKTVIFDGGQFIGTYVGQRFGTENQSILFLGADNKLYYPQPDTSDPNNPKYPSIGAQRAYFQLSSGTQARSFSLNFGEGDDATGIISMEDVRGKMEDVNGFWYSLDGRRLASKPIAKGVYIHNGKKVVIR